MEERKHPNCTGEEWIQERVTLFSWESDGWHEAMRTIDKELSQVHQCVENWKGPDSRGLAYAKRYAEALSARRVSLARQVLEGRHLRPEG